MKRATTKQPTPRDVAWDLYCRGACETVKDLARKSGMVYPALLRIMKRDRWEIERAREGTRRQLERQEQLLPWARKQAILAARRIIEVCRDRSVDLRTLHYEVREAGRATGVDMTAVRLAELRYEAEELEAGRMPDMDRRHNLFPNDPRWERPGAWYTSTDYVNDSRKLPPFGQRPGKPGDGAEKGEAISSRRIKRYLAANAKREARLEVSRKS